MIITQGLLSRLLMTQGYDLGFELDVEVIVRAASPVGLIVEVGRPIE